MPEGKLRDPEELRQEAGIDAPPEKKTKVEKLKLESNGLRGNVKEELEDSSTQNVSQDSYQLMKHFGIYQQDNRDTRIERKRAGKEKEWIFMLRTKIPGGAATAKQYLAMDNIADKHANGSLRLTTRQTVQFHGVVKGSLRPLVNDLNDSLLTAYGACGDVVRNTMADPVAEISSDPIYSCAGEMLELARAISDRYLPRSRSYFDIFIDDENVTEDLAPKAVHDETEETYGTTYMPRKFKIGITVPESNSVDIFTQDIGLVALRGKRGNLTGYNILIGGGLGFSHNKPHTYPRTGTAVAYVKRNDVLDAVHAIITIQRDYGDRTDRAQARLKYLVDRVGIKWFHEEMERRTGKAFARPRKVTNWGFDDHLGWHEQKDGLLYVGVFVENGRIAGKQREKIRRIVEEFQPQVRITPQQNLVLSHIAPGNRAAVQAILDDGAGLVGNGALSQIRRNQIACVALPTCGLALAESERVLPTLIGKLEEMGYGKERISIRMSGCPNSCSRAPVAEIGLFGRAPGKYNMHVGGDYLGTRTNLLFKESVLFEDLPQEIGRLIDRWRRERHNGEAFGDYCLRVGVEALQ